MMARWLASAFVFALACAIGTNASAQTPATTDTADDLVGTWLVTVAGEARTRTLVISRVTSTADGATLDAAYGLSDQGQGRVPAELRYGDNKQRQLMLTTQAQTKIVTSETPGGDFVGTFALANGVVKGVTISRAAAAQLVQKPAGDAPEVKLANVPPGLPPLAGQYKGTWKEDIGGRWFSGTNTLKVLRENQLDEKGTWSADVVFNSYGGQGPCGNWTDAKGQLRWRRNEVIFFVIRHPLEMCKTSWTMKFTRQPSGKLTWTQSDGLAEIVFDPN